MAGNPQKEIKEGKKGKATKGKKVLP